MDSCGGQKGGGRSQEAVLMVAGGTVWPVQPEARGTAGGGLEGVSEAQARWPAGTGW